MKKFTTLTTPLTERSPLSALLRKLDLQDQVVQTKAISLLTCQSSVGTVSERHEGETFRASCLPVLGKEDSSDTAVAFEDGAQVSFFCDL